MKEAKCEAPMTHRVRSAGTGRRRYDFLRREFPLKGRVTGAAAAGVAMGILCMATGCRSKLIRTGFERDPALEGWHPGVFSETRFEGAWVKTSPGSGRHGLAVSSGLWESPEWPAVPFAYYRVRFTYKSEHGGYRLVRCRDALAREIGADDHNTLDAAPDWTYGEFYTQARDGAATQRVAFGAGGSEFLLGSVRVERVSADEALAAADRLYATMPPVCHEVGPDRWRWLPSTRQALIEGRPLRILLLGDSIANDLGNSCVELLLGRVYPHARITLLRSIRSGSGCGYFRHHVKEDVIAKDPDLVVIAGISHGCDVAAMRSVVEQTRAGMRKPVEFLVLTGAVIQPGTSWVSKSREIESPPAAEHELAGAETRFYEELVRVRDDVPWATFDMRSAWEDYLTRSPHPRSWYQRDYIHANARGKQVLGRLLLEYFRPEDKFWAVNR